ncbi:MAG: PAS domain-containing protein [Bryobacterales bacterium]|nr:PAS domain-containing protein [Bryobacterales bacterium]
MNSLKTRLRISIVTLVTLLVFAQCVISLRIAAEDKFRDALERSESILAQVRHLVLVRVNEQAANARPQPKNVEELKALWQDIVVRDEPLALLLTKISANSTAPVVEILICDAQDRVLTASSPMEQRKPDYLSLPGLREWGDRPVWDRLLEVFTESRDYALIETLGVTGQTILTVRIIVSGVLLRSAIKPQVTSLALVSTFSLLASVIMAYLFSNLLLRSIERLSRTIENLAAGKPDPVSKPASGREVKEFADMQSKLDLLSQQFRGAKEDVHLLRNNIERMLERLEEGVLLFDPNGRLMRISNAAERLLGLSRDEISGRPFREIFPPDTPIGTLLEQVTSQQRPVRDAALTIERGPLPAVRVLVNVELMEGFPQLGKFSVLLTLRDLESRRQLRSQLDISTRLAAISRLTGGVAHEIKNPLNAIALHIEILKSRLREADLDSRELNVIASEISRLDRVVKTFLDFTRPVDLRLRDINLVDLAKQITSLVWPQAERAHVAVTFGAAQPVSTIRGDEDLLKQALLNVVTNGLEAMKTGGELKVRVEREGDDAVLFVSDTGPGIPPEVRDKIFNLYFSTKQKGSGIGLAMTFRIIQLHNATIEFTTEPGQGTTFRMRFPLVDDVEPSVEASVTQGVRV